VQEAVLLQVIVDLLAGKGRISPEVPAHRGLFISGYDGLQHVPPFMGAMDVPGTQPGTLAAAELIEPKDGVVAHTAKVAVVGGPFLLSVHRPRCYRGVHVEDDAPVGGTSHPLL